MTKAVRVENADNSTFKVRVRTYDKSGTNEPDILVYEEILSNPCDMTMPYIHANRYLVVDEPED